MVPSVASIVRRPWWGSCLNIDTIKLHGWETGCAHALFAGSDVTSSLNEEARYKRGLGRPRTCGDFE